VSNSKTLPDDAHDLRVRKNQPARLHGRRHPALGPPLRHRPLDPTPLNGEPMDNVRRSGRAAFAPVPPSATGGLVQSHLRQRADADGLGGAVQHVWAAADDHKLEYLSRRRQAALS
jgi:hypothetical protein